MKASIGHGRLKLEKKIIIIGSIVTSAELSVSHSIGNFKKHLVYISHHISIRVDIQFFNEFLFFAAHICLQLLFFPPKKPPENPRGSSELRSAIASGTWQRCVALLRSHQTELQIRFDHGDAQTFSGHWRLGLPWILFFFCDFC